MTERKELSMAAVASISHNLAFTVIFPLLLYSYASSPAGLNISVTLVLLSLSLCSLIQLQKDLKNFFFLRQNHRATSRAWRSSFAVRCRACVSSLAFTTTVRLYCTYYLEMLSFPSEMGKAIPVKVAQFNQSLFLFSDQKGQGFLSAF